MACVSQVCSDWNTEEGGACSGSWPSRALVHGPRSLPHSAAAAAAAQHGENEEVRKGRGESARASRRASKRAKCARARQGQQKKVQRYQLVLGRQLVCAGTAQHVASQLLSAHGRLDPASIAKGTAQLSRGGPAGVCDCKLHLCPVKQSDSRCRSHTSNLSSAPRFPDGAWRQFQCPLLPAGLLLPDAPIHSLAAPATTPMAPTKAMSACPMTNQEYGAPDRISTKIIPEYRKGHLYKPTSTHLGEVLVFCFKLGSLHRA
eukprot:1798402-Rhodomonas_salina.2